MAGLDGRNNRDVTCGKAERLGGKLVVDVKMSPGISLVAFLVM
jgi:hypothetical protein